LQRLCFNDASNRNIEEQDMNGKKMIAVFLLAGLIIGLPAPLQKALAAQKTVQMTVIECNT
jgi:hypothetical protein